MKATKASLDISAALRQWTINKDSTRRTKTLNKIKDFLHWLSHFAEGPRVQLRPPTWADIHPSMHVARHRGDCALDIMDRLRLDYPNPAFALPRGAIARVAHDLGCSRSYASKVARSHGYHQAER